MRVLFVTQYFPPETGAAPARALVYSVNQPVLSTSVALRFTRVP